VIYTPEYPDSKEWRAYWLGEARRGAANYKLVSIILGGKGGRPRIEDIAKTNEAKKPWLKKGMSRRTWYRRQAEKREKANGLG
jgi:hypothetical protein